MFELLDNLVSFLTHITRLSRLACKRNTPNVPLTSYKKARTFYASTTCRSNQLALAMQCQAAEAEASAAAKLISARCSPDSTSASAEIADHVWQVSFIHYDLGFFDDQECRVECAPNPFDAQVLPMSPD
jgi:putative transposase